MNLSAMKTIRLTKKYAIFWLTFIAIVLLNAGCTSVDPRDSAPKNVNIDLASIKDAVPEELPFSRYGNPKSYDVFGKTYHVLETNRGYKEQGDASWYGTKFHGKRASSGETYDMYAMTAAHKTLPIPSYVKVTNLDNQKQIIVKINDRGPFHTGRIIDLSYVAALKLDVVKHGTGRVEVEAIESASVVNFAKEKALFVQIGAFSEEQNAQRIHEKLSQASIKSHIHRVDLSAKQIIYRVRVGPFQQREGANSMLASIEKLGVVDAKIFTDNKE